MQTHVIYAPADPLNYVIEVGREEKSQQLLSLYGFRLKKIGSKNASLLHTG